MTKNTERIKAGIKDLARQPCEIISGTVVPGSYEDGSYTVSVRLSDGVAVIESVLLNATTSDSTGMIIVPADGSNVIIGCIDDSGIYTLLRSGQIEKMIIKTGSVHCEIAGNTIILKNGGVVLNISDALFKLNTTSESLFALLNDLLTALTLITVTTAGAVSGLPNNAASFTSLQTRLSNLLSA
jgi:hypothetical protein